MFCSCSAQHFHVKPNIHTCPVCLGLPGALPVPNQQAIKWCLVAGLALNCQIPTFSKFDRKNYFYPDLPKGYQISQYDLPFARNGELELKIENEKLKIIKIRRVHLEEDTAKLIHKGGSTLIDFNRSGVPLMEIVSEPDISSPKVAKAYLRKLQQIVRFLEISDCDMEKGSMRCEANISLQVKSLPDYKIEIKNLNSFRFVEKALEYEIRRQKELLFKGIKISQETRGWDEIKQVTFPQRVKETAADYRYFPEPDTPPIRWEEKAIEQLRNSLPELPDEKIKRYVKDFHLKEEEAQLLCRQKQTSSYFEEAIKTKGVDPAEIARLIVNKRINIQKIQPQQLIKKLQGLKKSTIADVRRLNKLIKEVIQENPKAVIDLQRGKQATIGFLIGQVMRKSQDRANPEITKKLLIEKLSRFTQKS